MQKGGEILLKRKAFIRKAENINDFYDVAPKALAAGSYGSVHICVHKITKEKRAVKVVPKYKMANIDSFLNEIELMRLLDHPNIIRLYEWFEDKRNVYIVMDFCEGGELFEKISAEGHFTEQVAANLFRDMMNSVNYCCGKKICHKDLKPENFMFAEKGENSTIKLIDFGLSQLFEDPSTGS
ncbi:MAG: protein kinase [Candidatus Pacebacteria bacterium]|nr:protein kinase [Candidatus Paceibacterota bacterium]